jgi:hypothetical protein
VNRYTTTVVRASAGANGFEEGRKLNDTISQSMHKTFTKRACDLQIQLADSCRRLADSFQQRFACTVATETVYVFVVQRRQQENRIEELERTLANEVQRSEEVQLIMILQSAELDELCEFKNFTPGGSVLS